MENNVTLNLETYDNLRAICDRYVMLVNSILKQSQLIKYGITDEKELVFYESRNLMRMLHDFEPTAYETRLAQVIAEKEVEEGKENPQE